MDGSTDSDAWKRFVKDPATAFLQAFDDPSDQAAIDIGATLWDGPGLNMTLNNLLAECRQRAEELNTTTMTRSMA